MRKRLTEPDDRLPGEAHEPRSRRALVTLLLVLAVTLFLVSDLQSVLIAPALGQLLGYASLGAVIVAFLSRERVTSDHFTFWDQAAVLIVFSSLAGAFTDEAAVGAVLENLSADDPAAGATPGP